jgi:hypothetical protein
MGTMGLAEEGVSGWIWGPKQDERDRTKGKGARTGRKSAVPLAVL